MLAFVKDIIKVDAAANILEIIDKLLKYCLLRGNTFGVFFALLSCSLCRKILFTFDEQ